MMPLQRCGDNFFTKGETGIRKQLEAVKWLELIALTKPFKAEGNKVEILLLYTERPSSIEERGHTLSRYTDDSPSKTNRPLRQIALSDKSPSNTSANFYEPEERAICPSWRQIALFITEDESPSLFLLETGGRIVSPT